MQESEGARRSLLGGVEMIRMLFRPNQVRQGGDFQLFQKLDDPRKANCYAKRNGCDLSTQSTPVQEETTPNQNEIERY